MGNARDERGGEECGWGEMQKGEGIKGTGMRWWGGSEDGMDVRDGIEDANQEEGIEEETT